MSDTGRYWADSVRFETVVSLVLQRVTIMGPPYTPLVGNFKVKRPLTACTEVSPYRLTGDGMDTHTGKAESIALPD